MPGTTLHRTLLPARARGSYLGLAPEHRVAPTDARQTDLLVRAGAIAVAAALAVWAFIPFVATAVDAAIHHRVFLGVAGYFPWDGLQYLAFIRDGHDGLIRNLYGLTGRPVFVHPMWSATGIVQGLTGVGPALVMAFWKVVGVGVLFAGAARLAARHIPRRQPGRRTAALALCLFGGFTPLAFWLWSGNHGIARGTAIDLMPAAALWDYAPIAIAIGLMPFAIEGTERVIAGSATRRQAFGTALACLLIAWLHPWQAGTLMLIWIGLLLWRCHDQLGAGPRRSALKRGWSALSGRRWRIAAVLVATAVPAVYYMLLSRLDASWGSFSRVDGRDLQLTWPVVEYALIPLVVVAIFGVRAARRDDRARALVLWPLATFILLALSPPEQFHTLDGLVLPVAVLAVRAWPSVRRGASRLVTVVTLALLAATTVLFALDSVTFIQSGAVTNYSELRPNDVQAVSVAARAAGGEPILSSPELGSAIPALADVSTWSGNLFWTPNAALRGIQAHELFEGFDSPVSARQLVSSSRTNVVLEPCGWPASLTDVLVHLGFRGRTVGCARVYVRDRAGTGHGAHG